MLSERFNEVISKRKAGFNSTLVSKQAKKMSRDEEIKARKEPVVKLMYQEFLKIILDFQLQEHEKFLSAFTQLFKSVDSDSNGILDENQFRELIVRMNVC